MKITIQTCFNGKALIAGIILLSCMEACKKENIETKPLETKSPVSAIYYQDINPDKVMDTWNSTFVHIDSSITHTPGSPDAPGTLTIWEDFGTQINVSTYSGCEILMSGTYPIALALNQAISSTGTWVIPHQAILNDGTNGNWKGVTDKYLGVRVKKGTKWLYGWIRMDINVSGTSVTIKDYACNRTADADINAGQK